MHIIEWDDFLAQKQVTDTGLAVTIGVFDGVHKGHQALIGRITRRNAGETPLSTVITFRQNPKNVLNPDTFQGDIFSLKQKLETFESLSVYQTILIDFSGNFSKLTGREFVEILKNHCRIRYLAVGSNFRCGYRLDTDAHAIADLMGAAVCTELVEPVFEGQSTVSSSRVREAVLAGDIPLAAALLGRNVSIDLSGISAASAGAYRSFDMVKEKRIIPCSGRYQVLMRKTASPEREKREIFIEDGKIFIPAEAGMQNFNTEYVEFI
ncbi:MAG: FAD synthetase family protein [Treponema sp.]|jgi:riboflavin kinase/FMN adenylyltransferase|nr:FAD synthetase family protein [Treponema sp.]